MLKARLQSSPLMVSVVFRACRDTGVCGEAGRPFLHALLVDVEHRTGGHGTNRLMLSGQQTPTHLRRRRDWLDARRRLALEGLDPQTPICLRECQKLTCTP